MASLISQNVIRKDHAKKVKRKANDEPSIHNEKEQIEDIRLSNSDTTSKKKNKKLEMEQEKEIKKLENSLFGSLYSPVEFGKNEEDEVENNSAMFIIDRVTNSALSEEIKQRNPVWVDEEEEKTSVNIAKVNKLRKLRKEEEESVISGSTYVSRLRAHYMKLNPGTEWAQLDSSDSDEGGIVVDPDDILQTNEDLIVKNSKKLLPGILEYSRLVDANSEDSSNAPINSVQFHRNSQLLLVGGLDKTLRFFQIDGKQNTKVQSIFLEDCPIRKASFLPDGSQVIISGRRKFFYSLDLVKATVNKIGPLSGREEKSLEGFEVSPDSKTIAFIGNEGYILLVSSRTKELIGTMKMNGTVRSLSFTNDGQQLLSSGSDGQVYRWDLRTRTCLHKGIDEGCLTGSSLCTSPHGNLFAAGSESGVVNVYNGEEFLGGKRKPIKAIDNLTTKVDFMKFNNDAQILAISSSMKRNSLKLVHVPSYTVFSNWPPANRTLGYPRCLDFSPHGGFMAMGNASGKVMLYKLHHYHNA